MPRLEVVGLGTLTVEVNWDPAVRVPEDGARVAVNGVAGPTVPEPATVAVRVTGPAKLFRLVTVITAEAETPTGWSSVPGVALTSKSGAGTLTAM